MKYINAAEVLPEELVLEISKYINGKLIYIPSTLAKKQWGENSGSKYYYYERNQEIKKRYLLGNSIEELMESFSLSYESIRKIIKK